MERFEIERQQLQRRAELKGKLTKEDQQRLDELQSQRIEDYLDAGHGECWLKRPVVARLVKNALLHFEDSRYQLHEWVVMPNHVHAVVRPTGTHTLSSILHSWKSFTANEANKTIERVGHEFWQRESYDHLIRDDEEFSRLRHYVRNNPVKAGLCQRPEDWPYGSAFEVAQASSLPKDVVADSALKEPR